MLLPSWHTMFISVGTDGLMRMEATCRTRAILSRSLCRMESFPCLYWMYLFCHEAKTLPVHLSTHPDFTSVMWSRRVLGTLMLLDYNLRERERVGRGGERGREGGKSKVERERVIGEGREGEKS